MAANPDKYQVIFMGLEKGKMLSLEINGISIRITEEAKLPGITIGSSCSFRVMWKLFVKRQTKT